MPTIFTHPVVPIALAIGLGHNVVSGRLLAAGIVASIAPDFDVIAFKLGIAYDHILGHRGLSHSLGFAVAMALLAWAAAPWLKARRSVALALVFIAALSHGVLDMLTNGGLGIALLWPFSDARYFAPWQPVQVSPIGITQFFNARGAAVLKSELVWVWLPAIALGVSMAIGRRIGTRPGGR